MADICIIYATADARAIPPTLEAELSDAWSIWWAGKIPSGDYREHIERELPVAGCVIPIWSSAARESRVLHDELNIAKNSGVPILPIRIENVRPPLGFGVDNTLDMLGWRGERGRPEIGELRARIKKTIDDRRAALSRSDDIGFGDSSKLPAFFFSISSHETRLSPNEAIKALDVFGAKSILVSAYDLAKGRRTNEMIRRLKRRRENDSIILLDSGNYEKFRLDDKKWTLKAFHDVVAMELHDLAFCYDELFPKGGINQIVKRVVGAVSRDSKHTSAPVLPIAHLPRVRNGEYRIDLAPELVYRIAQALRPPMIAIPERELGPSLFLRVKAMHDIRKKLRNLNYYQPVHVLGTGNPITIALLAAAGADSFDGLEWCRYVADVKTSTLHHFQQYELFQYQDELAASRITVDAAMDPKIDYAGKTVFHNLDFYTTWVLKLRAAVKDDKRLVEFMTKLLPEGAMEQAKHTLEGVL
jgi:hypothetical protein